MEEVPMVEIQITGRDKTKKKQEKPANWRASSLLAEREESLKWMLLDMYNNVIPLFSVTLNLIFTFYNHTFSNDVSKRGSRR